MPNFTARVAEHHKTVALRFNDLAAVPHANYVVRSHPNKTVPLTLNVFPACTVSATAIHRNRANAWQRLG